MSVEMLVYRDDPADGDLVQAMKPSMKMLALMKYGARAASTRQRLLQYLPSLAQAGIQVEAATLFDDDYLRALAQRKSPGRLVIAGAYAKRLAQLPAGRKHDAVFLQYEAFPYLPAGFERLVGLVSRKLIIDYDDAIFHQYDRHPNGLVRKGLGRKLQPLLARADLCICGNAYIQKYVARYCSNTIVVPTVVDVERYAPRGVAPTGRPLVGWIGSPSTFEQLRGTLGVLAGARERLGIDLRVVGSGLKDGAIEGVAFADWAEDREIPEIAGMDIGVMPLPDDPWARGKCGYKLIQYMACALPVIASPVGMNVDIVEHGVNGFLANTEQEWLEAVEKLARDPELRGRMGQAGREKVVREYSLQAQAPLLVSAFRNVLAS